MKSTNILNILLFIASSSIAIVLSNPAGPTVVNSVSHGSKSYIRQATKGRKTLSKTFNNQLTNQKHAHFHNFLEKHGVNKDAAFTSYKGKQHKFKLDNGKIKYNAKTGDIWHYVTEPGFLFRDTAQPPKTTITHYDKNGNIKSVRSYETLAPGKRQHYNANGDKTFITTKGETVNGFTPITKTTGEGKNAITETLFLKDANGNRFLDPKIYANGKLRADGVAGINKANEKVPEIKQIEKAVETLDAQGGKYKGMGRKILKVLGYGAGAVLVLALLNALITKSHEKEEPAASSISDQSSSSVTDPLISTSPFSPPVPASSLPPTIPSSAGFPSMSGFSGTPPAVPAF